MSEINISSENSATLLTSDRTAPTAFRRFSIWQTVIVAIVMMTALGGYLLVLNWRGGDAVFITKGPLADCIPFQPAGCWVYLISYIIRAIVIGFLRRPT